MRALVGLALAAVAVGVTATIAGPTPAATGAWHRLAPAPKPAATASTVSVWTGTQMLVFGRRQPNPPWSVDTAAAYNPATGKWRRLTPLKGPTGNYEGHYSAVWTGKEMLVWGPFDNQAYDPRTNRWRRLPRDAPIGIGLVAWTGREVIGWGGGCCGEASSSGSAYNPATNAFRKLPRSPLAPSQAPIGAWTGRELVVVVSGLDPDEKPYPAALARAAAYNPKTNSWRRIARPPSLRVGATAVWDGREVLVVGGSAAGLGLDPPTRAGLAYDPTRNVWRRLPPMPSGRASFTAVWAGNRLLLWGGRTDAGIGAPVIPSRGLAYAPAANAWSLLPPAPLTGRLSPTSVWAGHAMIVWGGSRPRQSPATGTRSFTDGAAFTPAARY
jgi:hypothetical protein